MAQAARLRPMGRLGRPTSTSTIYRWVACGLRGHRLEAIRLGGTLYTSREAIQRFADRLTVGPASSVAPSSEADRRRASAAADAELARLGI
jgi:hypothetical protein